MVNLAEWALNKKDYFDSAPLGFLNGCAGILFSYGNNHLGFFYRHENSFLIDVFSIQDAKLISTDGFGLTIFVEPNKIQPEHYDKNKKEHYSHLRELERCGI